MLLLLLSVVVAAIVASGLGGQIAGEITDLVCRIGGGECESGQAGRPGGADKAADLERRQEAVAGLGGEGAGYQELLDQAEAARQAGDLDEAERLVKQLRVRLERVESGKRTLLAGYQARIDAASPPDAPLPVLLICGGRREASEVTFGVTVGVKAVTSFDDPDPLPVQDTARSGLVVSGGSPAAADFAAFKLRFERP